MTVTATAPTSPPERSLQQRRDALRKANQIRTVRAEYKLALGAMSPHLARAEITTLLRDPPEDMASMQITKLLLAVPKLGTAKVSRLLRDANVSPSKTLAGLTSRQVLSIISSPHFRGGY